MATSTWIHSLASDLVNVGIDDDGQDVIRTLYFVVLTNELGERYRSNFSSFDLEEARDYCVQVAKYLVLGSSPVGSSKWTETYPEYGSPTYSGAEEAAWERSLES